jgi:hypothetical protein
MMNRMVGSVLTLMSLLFSGGPVAAQTYTQMQWGMNKGVTPYQFGANINGTWSNLGTVSSAGVWSLPSTNLSFTQSGAGAVPMTVDAKLKQSVNVKDFGAKCDGLTDDTAAIQTALDSGTNISVSLPGNATCKITSTLIINNPNVRLHGEGFGSVLKLGISATAHTVPLVRSEATASGFEIDHLTADHNTVPTTADPLCGSALDFPNGSAILIMSDESSYHDIYAKNAFDSGVAIGRYTCNASTSTITQFNGSPQRVNGYNIHGYSNGRGNHTYGLVTGWGGSTVNYLTGNGNVSGVTDLFSNTCVIFDYAGGANGSLTNAYCSYPQVSPSGGGGQCLYVGAKQINVDNLVCAGATGTEAIWVDAYSGYSNFSNIVIAFPSTHGIRVTSNSSNSPKNLNFSNIQMTDVSLNNLNVGAAWRFDTSGGGGLDNLNIVNTTVSSPNGVVYTAYGMQFITGGTFTGSATGVNLDGFISAVYSNIPSTFRVEDNTLNRNTPSVSSCGTGAVWASGTFQAGEVAVGSTNPTTSCTISVNQSHLPYNNPPRCSCTVLGSSTSCGVSAKTTSSVTFTTSADVHDQFLTLMCRP